MNKLQKLEERYFNARGRFLLTDCCDSMREMEQLEIDIDDCLPETQGISEDKIDEIIKKLNDKLADEFGVLIRVGRSIECIQPD